MTKILEFKKPEPKKKKPRKHSRRNVSITDKFDELNKRWHKNEREFTDLFNEYLPHEKKYFKESLRIYKVLKKFTFKTILKNGHRINSFRRTTLRVNYSVIRGPLSAS